MTAHWPSPAAAGAGCLPLLLPAQLGVPLMVHVYCQLVPCEAAALSLEGLRWRRQAEALPMQALQPLITIDDERESSDFIDE